MKAEFEYRPSLGALPEDGRFNFRVWAPASTGVELLLDDRRIPMEPEADGYFLAQGVEAGPGDLYHYLLDGNRKFPDPASRFQPQGVHGPSQVVTAESYHWRHEAPSIPLSQTVVYELHVGTFTPEGTYRSAQDKLPYLADLGVTAVEIMPVADFAGRWNWGYDPGAFFAPSRAYGSPDELRSLVDEAHGLGLSVILDVVYNHFGPDGAYFPALSPFALTDRHHTPWGQALDFDGPHSHGVRRYCLESALMWLHEYRFDGLRLDATFAIIDDGPHHFLSQLSEAARALPGPRRTLIAEDPRNLRNLVLPSGEGGTGLDAVWADDFHHQMRSRLTGEDQSYYRDFTGTSSQIAATVQGNWFYSGHHSLHHGAPRGTPAGDLAAEHFVYCIQNHDQVGNRPRGDRLGQAVSEEQYRAASTLLLFLPQMPLLFMGQEWAASTPFQFFTDHAGELGQQVSEGRRREFADFSFDSDVPDPQDPETFRRSRLDWNELEEPSHARVLHLYRDLLARRRSLAGPVQIEAQQPGGLLLRRGDHLLAVAFEPQTELELPFDVTLEWNSEDERYAEDSLPPRISSGRLNFERAGAALLVRESGS